MTNQTACRELLPCPFCGSSMGMLMREDSLNFAVLCAHVPGKGGCGMRGPYRRSEDEAAIAWNTRPTPSVDVETLKAVAWFRPDNGEKGFEKLQRLITLQDFGGEVNRHHAEAFAKQYGYAPINPRTGRSPSIDEATLASMSGEDARIANVVRQMRNAATDLKNIKSLTGAWVADTLNWYANELAIDADLDATRGEKGNV